MPLAERFWPILLLAAPSCAFVDDAHDEPKLYGASGSGGSGAAAMAFIVAVAE